MIDRENWMSHLDKTVKLVDTHIPASHDASAYPTTNLFATMLNDFVGAITQIAGYTAQLNAGIRYFDMRIAKVGSELRMHHSSLHFERFQEVLTQIRNFSDAHPGEYIFMDLDFTDGNGIDGEILSALESVLDSRKFATAHLSGGVFRPDVTWADLGDTRFLITWSKQGTNDRNYLSNCDNFRTSPFDSFGLKENSEIIRYVQNALDGWDRRKLMICQLVRTPLASPLERPAWLDKHFWPLSGEFINGNLRRTVGNKPNVVLRDFVSARYNRAQITELIAANRFSSSAEMPNLSDRVHQGDFVRFRVEGQPLYLSIGPSHRFTVAEIPDSPGSPDPSRFAIPDYHPDNRGELPYSGNFDGNQVTDQGNFRLVWPQTSHVTNATHCASVAPDNPSVTKGTNSQDLQLYWGMTWGEANDRETFTCFNPDDLQDDGNLYYGSRVIIRSMLGATDGPWGRIGHALEHAALALVPFLGSAAEDATQSAATTAFLTLVYENSQHLGIPLVLAGSPGPDYATTFVLERADAEPVRPPPPYIPPPPPSPPVKPWDPPLGNGVDGQNVRDVSFVARYGPKGEEIQMFQMVDRSRDNHWERTPSGREMPYECQYWDVQRDAWSVYLVCDFVNVQIDLYRKIVLFHEGGSTPRNDRVPIRQVSSGLVLSLRGDRVEVAPFAGLDTQLWWRYWPVQIPDNPLFFLRPTGRGDVVAGIRNGGEIGRFDELELVGDRGGIFWTLEPQGPYFVLKEIYSMTNTWSGKVLDVVDGKAVLRPANGSASQLWTANAFMELTHATDAFDRTLAYHGQRNILASGANPSVPWHWLCLFELGERSSTDGRFRLIYQSDGNLVLYDAVDGAVMWSTDTWNRSLGFVAVDSFGYLTVYDGKNEPAWRSPAAAPGGHLVVQADGNLVLCSPTGEAVWESNTRKVELTPAKPTDGGGDDSTSGGADMSILVSGGRLNVNEERYSSDRSYRLVYQTNGELILWDTRTNARLWSRSLTPTGHVVMEKSGHLVAYTESGTVLWQSNKGVADGHLVVQTDGNVVIVSPTGDPAWASRYDL
jgi:hypothetical protein